MNMQVYFFLSPPIPEALDEERKPSDIPGSVKALPLHAPIVRCLAQCYFMGAAGNLCNIIGNSRMWSFNQIVLSEKDILCRSTGYLWAIPYSRGDPSLAEEQWWSDSPVKDCSRRTCQESFSRDCREQNARLLFKYIKTNPVHIIKMHQRNQ